MIVGERKPFDEIKESARDHKNILILGCGTCVSVCMAGGEKEVELLASQLRIARGLEKTDIKIAEATIQRQCDREYIEPIIELAKNCDAVVSMACGAGVQLVAEMLEPLQVIPAVNTRFIGIAEAEGAWAERCRACGNCLLDHFGGICPMTRCAKSLVNGPCGGSRLGKCELGDGRDCAWILIYNRLKSQGRLDNIRNGVLIKDYSKQTYPARLISE